MKIFIFLTCILCISGSLSPKSNHKRSRTPAPSDWERSELVSALYCNDDDMQVGDVCYCGRISLSCCSSKDKCTGTVTRSCSKKADDNECFNQVRKGLGYWEEMKNIKEKMQCSNQHYDKNSPCFCGKIMVSCCKSKSHCDVGLFNEKCDSKLDDKKCSDIKLSLTNLTEPKYYREYVQVFSSSSEKIYGLSVVIMSFIFIIL